MFVFDHVAIPSRNIAKSVRFYVKRFGARVLYRNKTWAFLEIGREKVALVSPLQHPGHIAFRVTGKRLEEEARKAGKKIIRHRDGTHSIYLADPEGNHVELIYYPRPGRK